MDHSTMDHGMQHVVAAAGGFDYGLAFMAGVLGSGHCLGMCGALVSGYFMKAGPSRTLSAVFLFISLPGYLFTRWSDLPRLRSASFWFPAACSVKFKASCKCSLVLSSLFSPWAF